MTLEEYAKQQKQIVEDYPTTQSTITPLAMKQAAEKRDQAHVIDIYKEYQENIRKIGTLSTEIIKGVQKGENLAILFLKAVKAYTLCTGNDADYDIIEKTLKITYKESLAEQSMEIDKEKK